MLHKVYGESCLKKTAFHEWFSRFWEGQESMVDNDRSGRTSTTRTDENITRFAALLKKDH